MTENYVTPQLRIFQEFEPDTSVVTAPMGACILAPFYKVFEGVSLGAYLTSGKTTPYPGLSGGDLADTSDSAKAVRILNALIQRVKVTSDTEFTLTSATLVTKRLLADSAAIKVPEGVPAFQVGDTVRFTYSAGDPKDSTITGFASSGTIVAAVSTPKTSGGQVLTVDGSGATFASPKSFTGLITDSFTAGSGNPSFMVQDETGTIVYTNTGGAATFADLAIYGGVELSFGSGSIWWEGDTFSFAVVPEMLSTKGGFNAVVLTPTPTASPTGFSILRIESAYFTAITTSPTGSKSEVQFGASSVTAPANLLYEGCAVLGGDLEVDFRARSGMFNENLFSCGSAKEAEELFGNVTARNPLGLMVVTAIANANGRAVSFMGVTNQTVAGYTAAIDLLEEDSQAYGIAPYTTDQTILLALASRIAYLSGPEVMNWKVGWFAKDLAVESTILSALTVTANGTLSVTVAGGSVVTAKVGDKLVFSSGRKAEITGVTALTSTLAVDQIIPAGTYTASSITHPLTPQERAATVTNPYNSYRIRLVVTPGITSTSDPSTLLSNSYMAAACAGYRSGVAPHQPLTRAEVKGLVIPSMTGLSTIALNQMAAKGVWLVVRDNSGRAFIRHQLTTDVDNYKTREDSKISNADEISRYHRQALEGYFGKANITDEFIDALYVELMSVAQILTGREYSSLLGPQVLSSSAPVIRKDPNLSDRLLIYIKYTTPDPANYIDVYLTIV